MKSGPITDRKRISPHPRRLYLIFTLLTILSWVSLDFLSWRKEENSLFFSALFQVPKGAEVERPVEELVLASITESGVPKSAIERSQDDSGIPQMVVHVPLEVYSSLAFKLEKQLLELGASLIKEEEEREQDVAFLWRVKKKKEDKLFLRFSCPRPLPAEKKIMPPTRLAKNSVAIIIDDMGFSLEALQLICDLKIPITIAILPLSPYARETAQVAHQNGLEIMLHLPGESLNYQEENNGTSSFIRSEMGEEEIRILTEDFLARVPFVQGVKVHEAE